MIQLRNRSLYFKKLASIAVGNIAEAGSDQSHVLKGKHRFGEETWGGFQNLSSLHPTYFHQKV
ncbi:MAG: hypothetical protein COU10_00825 [Candidatus Harrisonbacteria bacterium CG10_big_fil_rev_8_21_14_0_10_45_28]|uniref:Uncharacterized protein n=1 Tax=Candidatus Harrisonbacteria bacterium CG10_big_fil_rev_8_21_14_0_10_45_28 TaxID=1974586 RepID=A0A2H0UP10_9BACT|nr:MAG: hypothetical protein COU10_00825 [Candidatus Harrisonbacteria bacterium CG10_big_fil_rev_8_21_14_0_10_45_28]